MFDEAEIANSPSLDAAIYDRLRAALASGGQAAAVERLVDDLRTAGDFQNLFYALLMKKRVELGVSPFPTGPANELPADTRRAIRTGDPRGGPRSWQCTSRTQTIRPGVGILSHAQ